MSMNFQKSKASYPISHKIGRERYRKKWVTKYHVQTSEHDLRIVYGYDELKREMARAVKDIRRGCGN